MLTGIHITYRGSRPEVARNDSQTCDIKVLTTLRLQHQLGQLELTDLTNLSEVILTIQPVMEMLQGQRVDRQSTGASFPGIARVGRFVRRIRP